LLINTMFIYLHHFCIYEILCRSLFLLSWASCGNGKRKLVQSLAVCALVEAMTRAAIMIGHSCRRCAQAEDAVGAQDPHCISISICTSTWFPSKMISFFVLQSIYI
jgi:hypothetical protein